MGNNISLENAHLRYRERIDDKQALAKQYNSAECKNGLFELTVVNDGGNISIAVELKEELIVELFLVSFKIKKEGKTQCLNREYQFKDICTETRNNDFTPLHVQFRSDGVNYLLSNTQQWFNHTVKDEGAFLNFTIFLDAAAMHPAWSHREAERKTDAVRIRNAGHTYQLNFAITKLQKGGDRPKLSRYPFGAEAGFVITDHCDYDQADTLHTFLHGNDGDGEWLGKGLKLTKGVFTLRSERKKENAAASLQDENYKALIEKLYADGSEIAPHALNQSGQLSIEPFEQALASITKAYNCRTWIDHGSYQQYTYSVGGAANNEYRLLDKLNAFNYTSLWSYYDAPIDAAQSLNIFSNTTTSYKQVTRNILKGKAATAGHYLKTISERKAQTTGNKPLLVKLMGAVRKNLINKKSISGLIKDIRAAFKYSQVQALNYKSEELKQFSPVLYTESRQPFYNREKNELILFATQEVVHTKDAYKLEALAKLIATRGLHIGHTYLLNTLSYLNGIFNKGTKQLSKEWVAFVNALSQYVAEGKVWNPTMQEFVAYTKQVQAIEISYNTDNSITLKNNSDRAVQGLSFIIVGLEAARLLWDGNQPKYKSTDNKSEIIFWGDVPSNTTVHVSW